MKSLIASICILGLVGMVVGVGVQGADEASVSATVTVKSISVTVSPTSFDYGVLDAGTTSDPMPIAGITASNDGNVAEDFDIKGSDTTDWQLVVGTPGTDEYKHEFAHDPYTTWTVLPLDTGENPDYTTLATNVGTSGTDVFKLKLTAPSLNTGASQQTAQVTVRATES